ncbi:vanadium-dependent haloperoxidase [Streptomyces sp. NPDC003719]
MTTPRRSPLAAVAPRRRSLLLGGASTVTLATMGLGGTAAAGTPTGSAAPAPVDFDFDTGNFIWDLIYRFSPLESAIAPMDATVLHRFVHLSTTAWFDAVAPYHPTAVGVHSRLGRRPSGEAATNRNKNIAGMYASYRVVQGVEPGRETAFRDLMIAVGLDPDDTSEDRTSPVGIGNLAGKAVVAAAERDGMNQLGDVGRRYNGQPYADYTGYRPVNTAYELENPSRWQPNRGPHSRRLGGGSGDKGIFVVQHFVTPQMALTKPHSFRDPSRFKLAPPRHSDHTRARDYKRSVDEVLEASAGLTDEQKVAVEFFDDKLLGIGRSVGAAGRAHADQMDLDRWIHLFFTNTVALYDALIVCWYQKAKYDSVRPFSAIRHVYGRSPVTAWGGPGRGTVTDIPANEWTSYLNVGDHPEYPSGSTTLCAAQAQAVRRFFDDDVLDLGFTMAAGRTRVEPGTTPARDVGLHYATWTDFVRECAVSRVRGGVHFKKTVEESIPFGTQFGDLGYEFAQRHIKGDVAS